MHIPEIQLEQAYAIFSFGILFFVYYIEWKAYSDSVSTSMSEITWQWPHDEYSTFDFY